MKISKQCVSCLRIKLLKEFNIDKRHKDGFGSYCKLCREYKRARYSMDKEGRDIFTNRSGTQSLKYSKRDRDRDAREALRELTE